jgi:hypothetical protein
VTRYVWYDAPTLSGESDVRTREAVMDETQIIDDQMAAYDADHPVDPGGGGEGGEPEAGAAPTE